MFPFILLIGLAVYVGGRYAAAHASADNEVHIAGELATGSAPGPIAVLGELLRLKQYPSPQVIMCAIAEAESLGRGDVAIHIVETFIAPVVQRHQLANARNANPSQPPPMYAPPMPAYPPAADPMYAQSASMPMPSYMATPPAQAQSGYDKFRAPRDLMSEFRNAPRADEPLPVPAKAAAPAQAAQNQRTYAMPHGMEHLPVAPNQPTDDELIAQMLGQPMPEKAPVDAQGQVQQQAPSPASSAVSIAGEVSFEQHHDRGRQTMPPPMRHAETPAAPSPIDEVDDATWNKFAARLERETPMYSSGRAVGQYRQRRERLAELGIDADSLLGSSTMQRAAFDIDMADAYHHAREGGMIHENVRRMIKVPGATGPCIVTLSGVLGVIQLAGLEGACRWFKNQEDRKKYTYTTRMFLQTNGAF